MAARTGGGHLSSGAPACAGAFCIVWAADSPTTRPRSRSSRCSPGRSSWPRSRSSRGAAAARPRRRHCPCSNGRWNGSGRPSRSAQDARPPCRGRVSLMERCPPPWLIMYAALFAFQPLRSRAASPGAHRAPTRRTGGRDPGRRRGRAAPSCAVRWGAPSSSSDSWCRGGCRGGGSTPPTAGWTPP